MTSIKDPSALMRLDPHRTEGQVVPVTLDADRYSADHQRYLAALKAQGLDPGLYDAAFSPYPFAVNPEGLQVLVDLQQTIQRAIVAIVTNFSRDPRINTVIRLSPEELRCVGLAAALPYRPGAFRPDFVHAADGRATVVEINARFPLNGFLSSMALNRAVPTLYPELKPLPGLTDLEQRLRSRLGADGTLGIVKGAEAGWDINLLPAWVAGRCEFVQPQALTVEALQRWRGVLLEIHQEELVRDLPAAALATLASHPGLLNDLRTILIAHDKRLLSLLSTADVLRDYLAEDDVKRLKRHVTPTWVKGAAPERVQEALASPEGWLVKPPRSGKGQGILVSKHLTPSEWRERLLAIPDDWILQPYIEQAMSSLVVMEQGKLTTKTVKVVGVLPALDDQGFGPGMYRAAADDIVNVARGGTILAPTLFDGIRS